MPVESGETVYLSFPAGTLSKASSQSCSSTAFRWRKLHASAQNSAQSQDVELATLEWVDWFDNRRFLGPTGNTPQRRPKQTSTRSLPRFSPLSHREPETRSSPDRPPIMPTFSKDASFAVESQHRYLGTSMPSGGRSPHRLPSSGVMLYLLVLARFPSRAMKPLPLKTIQDPEGCRISRGCRPSCSASSSMSRR